MVTRGFHGQVSSSQQVSPTEIISLQLSVDEKQINLSYTPFFR